MKFREFLQEARYNIGLNDKGPPKGKQDISGLTKIGMPRQMANGIAKVIYLVKDSSGAPWGNQPKETDPGISRNDVDDNLVIRELDGKWLAIAYPTQGDPYSPYKNKYVVWDESGKATTHPTVAAAKKIFGRGKKGNYWYIRSVRVLDT